MDIHLNGIHSNVRPGVSVSYGISRQFRRARVSAW
jgi:hypothetical protein